MLLITFACAATRTAETAALRIMLYGDSISAGSNIADGKASDAWATLVQAKGKIEFINVSRGGRSTNSEKDFIEALKSSSRLDAIIIALGTNDARDLSTNMVVNAVAHIDAMVVAAKAAGVKRFVIFGPTNINKNALKASFNIRSERDENTKNLNAAYEKYTKEKNLGFISLYGRVPEDSLRADGVHPDKAGNIALAEFLADKIISVLQSPQTEKAHVNPAGGQQAPVRDKNQNNSP